MTSQEASFSLSIKNKNAQLTEPLLTVRGDSAQELITNAQALGLDIGSILGGFGATTVPAATDVAVNNIATAGLNPAVVAPAPAQPVGDPAQYQGSPQAIAAAAAPPAAPVTPWGPPAQQAQVAGLQCAHGPMTWRQGTSKRGPWSAWFCPTPKNTPGQCDPIWQDDDAYVAPTQ